MSAITDVLQRVFSQKVIVKRMPGNRTRVIDYNKAQSIGSPLAASPYLNGFRKNSNFGTNALGRNSYGSAYNNQINQIDALRKILYVDYELMDTDAILSAALDIYADESTVKNEQGRMLTIKSENDQVKEVLHNLYFDILNVEFNLWHWIRSLCKFGDLFLYLELQPTLGVLDAIPIHSGLMSRNEQTGENHDQTQYVYEGQGNVSLSKNLFAFHEIAHFRLLSDTNYLPYGKSMLDGARKVFKQLSMMEDAMLIQRIMRAPERRKFKIDVGNIPPESIPQYIKDIADTMKKTPYIDEATGDYNLKFNLMNMLEDYFLPVRGTESGTDVEALPGLGNEGAIEDIDYIHSKLLAYLKIPKAYLGYDENLDGKGTLAAEDIRFARLIERIQKIVVSELEKIGHIHLYLQGFSTEEIMDFSLTLATPSLIYERQKIDLLNEKVNLVGNIKDHYLLPDKYLLENIFNITEDQIPEIEEYLVQDAKKKFRLTQIEEEGNDPQVSKQSFGTPHDITSMQMSSKLGNQPSQNAAKSLYPDQNDGRHENEGRPEKQGSFERDKDPAYGRDPTGRKQLTMGAEDKLLKNLLIKFPDVRKKVIVELNETKKTDMFESIDMLNEKSLIEE